MEMDSVSRKLVAARALTLLDLTDLSDDCNAHSIDRLCQRAKTKHGPVAAICIWPRMISHAKPQLAGSGIRIATVVNFPSGDLGTDEVVSQTLDAITNGADEIDMVIPYRKLLAGDTTAVSTMVTAIRSATASSPAVLKVILETGELQDATVVRVASELAIAAGADFIKTSTGKVAVNATLEAAETMLQTIADSGKLSVGFKPAGGIKTAEDCAAYLALADRILGSQWATPQTFRFGASSLLDDLLAALEGKSAQPPNGY